MDYPFLQLCWTPTQSFPAATKTSIYYIVFITKSKKVKHTQFKWIQGLQLWAARVVFSMCSSVVFFFYSFCQILHLVTKVCEQFQQRYGKVALSTFRKRPKRIRVILVMSPLQTFHYYFLIVYLERWQAHAMSFRAWAAFYKLCK